MLSLVLFLIGICLGMFIGIIAVLVIMGPKLRDQFLGRNQVNKPIVIDWADGRDQDFNILMSGMVIFTGVIQEISLQQSRMDGQRVHIELMSRAEGLRDARSI